MRPTRSAKRRRGVPVLDLDAWNDPWMPDPHARVAAVAVRPSESLVPQRQQASRRLEIEQTSTFTVMRAE